MKADIFRILEEHPGSTSYEVALDLRMRERTSSISAMLQQWWKRGLLKRRLGKHGFHYSVIPPEERT